MKKENWFIIALTYIGTIIGAGFASGQEIKMFFVDFGTIGITSFIISSFLFFYLGKKMMQMGYESKAESYERILTYAFTCKARKFFDYLIVFFLISTVTTMFSGMGAILNQNFDIPMWIGCFIMLIISVVVTLGGINKVIKLSMIAIPLLIFSTLLIAINSFEVNNFAGEYLRGNVFRALWYGIIYVSYNVIMAISILPVLGNVSKDIKSINKSAIISGIVIGVFGIIIFFSLLINYGTIQFAEVPLAILAKQSNWIYEALYFISFIIAVTTTAVSSLYGIYSRVWENKVRFILISVIAYVGSLFGFSVLVKYLYSFMGYLGCLIIFMLLRGFLKRKKANFVKKINT